MSKIVWNEITKTFIILAQFEFKKNVSEIQEKLYTPI